MGDELAIASAPALGAAPEVLARQCRLESVADATWRQPATPPCGGALNSSLYSAAANPPTSSRMWASLPAVVPSSAITLRCWRVACSDGHRALGHYEGNPLAGDGA